MSPLTVAAPPRVTDRLSRAAGGPRRSVTVLHRGPDALYLDLDGWCLGIVRSGAAQVPCALVLTTHAPLDLADVADVVVGDGPLVLDGTELRVARFLDVSVPRLDGVHVDAADILRSHAAPAVAELPSPTADDLTALVGRGSGLTPLGDDVLAGWLATSYALAGRATTSYDVRGRTTLLSATLVDCAARGEVLPEYAALVRALVTEDGEAVDAAAARLTRVGHTSGAGLLLGCALRLEQTDQTCRSAA